ncbi:MAG: hypothetical protein J6J79_00055 [Lachnospiraceae bacterium]|nr:hypothetical protein [Lachnospiraceae bacterium]
MLDYYNSWKLRGDHPCLYKTGVYEEKAGFVLSEYDNCMLQKDYNPKAVSWNLDKYRKSEGISELYYQYHYSESVKNKGYEVIEVEVTDWCVDIIAKMQQAMRKEVFLSGLCIECNPTSNYLIGTFRRYDNHSILQFNNYQHVDDSEHLNIPVSINTDDTRISKENRRR